MHVLRHHFLRKFLKVVHLCHRCDGEASQMGIEDEWLCVGVADDADARVATFETIECRFELRAEIRTFEVMDGTDETLFF